VQLAGGSSTLYEASGGGATVFWPNFNLDFGGGLVNGTPAVNVAAKFLWRGWDTTVGNQAFNSTVGSAGLFTNVLGLTLAKKDLVLFAGDVQPLLGGSFFKGTRLGLRGGAGSFYHHRFKSGWGVSSLAVASGAKLTSLGDVGYHRGNFDADGGGGWLLSKSLSQARMTYRFDGHLALSTNFLRTQGATFATIMGATGIGHVSVYLSKILGSRQGETYGGNVRVGIFDAGASYIAFKGNTSLGISLGERLGRHFILREYATRSQGRWGVSLGGGFTTNRFSIDVSQSTFFVPFGNAPLQRSLLATLHLQIPWRSVSLNLASGVTPDGKIRYGIDGTTFIGEGLGAQRSDHSYHSAGKYLITGTVVDERGQPVSGAAVRVGKELVFSDVSGSFFLHVKREGAVTLAVVPDEFTSPGYWVGITVPQQAAPGEQIRIVVRRGAP